MFGDPVKNEKGWVKRCLDDLFETRLGKMLDSKKQGGNNKYPYLGNSNVQWFKIHLTNLNEMEFDENERRTFALRKGDILVCEGGEVGRSAIWQHDNLDIFFQKAIHRLRPRNVDITPEYLVTLFRFFANFGGFKDYVSTSTISHLTGEKLKTIYIPLPPYDLQLQFAFYLKKLDESSLVLNNSNSEGLFHSLLQQAFSGELVE